MGCSDACCSVTGTGIGYTTESRTALLIVRPTIDERYGIYSNSLYKPKSLFIRGQYDDYGAVIPDKGQDFADEVIQRLVGCSLYDNNVWRTILDRDNSGEKRLRFVLVHESVLDYIVGVANFDTFNNTRSRIEAIIHILKNTEDMNDPFVLYEAWKDFDRNLAEILNEHYLTYGYRGDSLNQTEDILSIKTDLYSGEKIAKWFLDPERFVKLQEVGAFYSFFDNFLSRKVAPATQYQDQHIDLDIEKEKIKAQIGLLTVSQSILEQQKTYFEEYVDD